MPLLPNGRDLFMAIRGLEKGKKPALLISECQKGVIGPGLSLFEGLVSEAAEREIVPRIDSLAKAFREAGYPVVHLHVVHKPGYPDLPVTNVILANSTRHGRMVIGSVDVEPVDELRPSGNDIIHARSFSLVGFHGTELDATLRHMGVDTLVLAGVSTNVAISGTALCGSDLGYQVVVAEDCTAGSDAKTHEFICKNLLPLYSTVSDSSTISDTLGALES
jgi:nicotinamidase-related amidase